MKAKTIVWLTSLVLAVTGTTAICQGLDRIALSDISIAIEKAKMESSPRLRAEYAEQVYKLVEANSWEVNRQDIEGLAEMLNDPLDNVRLLAASSLATLGPRAQEAVPALRRALGKIECVGGDQTSEPEVRAALLSLGAPAPARNCLVTPDLAKAISRVKDANTPDIRAEYAKRLFELVKEESDRSKIRNPDIYALGGSLGGQDDTVRYWVATSIGYIGARAEIIVPELEDALKVLECDPESKKSASAIRSALKEGSSGSRVGNLRLSECLGPA